MRTLGGMAVILRVVNWALIRASLLRSAPVSFMIYRNLVTFRVENISYVIISCSLISYAPHIVYETRVKISLLNNISTFNFRTDGSVPN